MNSKELKAAEGKVTKIRLAVEKTEGKLEEILKGLGEDFKDDLPRYDSESRHQRETEQAEQLIKGYADSIGEANEELERIKEDTSAVYLWDPMFKIMKQNDIQLIAPGHKIPREITSRFGGSYLLNQDVLVLARGRGAEY